MTAMKDILFVVIGVSSIIAFVVAFVVARLLPSSRPKRIVVQQFEQQSTRGPGCLPLIIGGVLVIIALRLLASV